MILNRLAFAKGVGERVSKDLINNITRERFNFFKRSRIELVIIVSYPIIFL
jgi:hypothetical protein